MRHITVQELRHALRDLPEDMPVTGVGHFGEALEVYDFEVRLLFTPELIRAFTISIEDPGPEPD